MKKICHKIFFKIYFSCRKLRFSFFSNNSNVSGIINKSNYPVVFRGIGKIELGREIQVGVINSPEYYTSYGYLESRGEHATIVIGNGVRINNAISIVAEKRITIGNDVLIGYNCSIMDSNFHDLRPDNRNETDPNPKEVVIGNNVFLGNNVTILKGVVIGDNSVIGANSVVSNLVIPSNVIVAGNPARIVGKLD